MYCQHCKVEIPPSWSKVIASNTCPACGEFIVSEENKKIMDDLKNAIGRMSADPEELTGWLMSNYDLLPKGTVEPTNFHRKPDAEQLVTASGGKLKMANSATQQFMKRSGADKVLNNPKLAAIAQAINSVNAMDGSMYGEQAEEDPEISAEEQQEAMQEQLQSLAAKAKASGKRLSIKDALANSATFNLGESGTPLSDQETALMQAMVGGVNSGDPDMEGIEDLPPPLQQDRLKRLAAQRDLVHGGSSGLIKRSS